MRATYIYFKVHITILHIVSIVSVITHFSLKIPMILEPQEEQRVMQYFTSEKVNQLVILTKTFKRRCSSTMFSGQIKFSHAVNLINPTIVQLEISKILLVSHILQWLCVLKAP